MFVPSTVHPRYRTVARTIVGNQGIELVTLPYCTKQGHTLAESLNQTQKPAAALVVPQPNFFGTLEPVDALTDWAHAHGMLAIAVVNPVSLALLKPPGQWGERGADICVGDGHLIPLASGGPYFGFMTTHRSLVRQMPGRIVGRTADAEGRPGFILTLQARVDVKSLARDPAIDFNSANLNDPMPLSGVQFDGFGVQRDLSH